MAITQFDGHRQIKAGTITNAEQNFGTPSAGTDVAIKSYVDSVAQGLDVKPSAQAATVAALSPTNTYSAGVLTATGIGTLTVDGYSVVLNDYILVMNEASGLKNGLYKCTTQGTAGVAYVLTRAVEMDVSSEFAGAFVFVESGTVNAASGWVCTTVNPTVGSTSITFSQFSGAGQIINGTGISKSGNTLSIDTTVTVDKTTAQTLTNKTLTSPVINTPTGIVKGDVGLGNVDNTSDATKNAASVTLTNKTLTTPVLNGTVTGTSVSQTSSASTLVQRDGNSNAATNNFLEGYTTTATAAGTTTLAIGSTFLQFFTGATTQTVVLPVTSTLVLGHQFFIVNNSTGLVTVQSSGSNNVVILGANTSVLVTCILTSGTSAASWDAKYAGTLAATGKVLTASNTLTLAGTDGTTMTFPSSSATIARTDAGNTFTGHQTIEGVTATGATGTGNMVFNNTPTFVTPVLGAATATSLATSAASPLLMTNGQLVTVALTSQTTGVTTLTIPDFAGVADTFAFVTKAQTLSNKTFVAPVLGAATGTSLSVSSFINEAQATNIAAASTTNIGAANGNYVNITGTTTITAFDTVQAGTRRILNFNAALTLTYNASALILPTSVNITTAAGDTATFVSLGSGNWVCVEYQRRSGQPLAPSASSTYLKSTTVSGTQDSTNKVFTIANTVSSGSEQVYVNGQLMMPGSSNDYVYDGVVTVTFQAGFTAPASTDTIRVYGNY
jgi:hypothetical protein